jgi:PPOX class probable F420-dependent enzyme
MSAFPESHVDLLDRPLPAVLTTEMPDGRFQSTVVWFNRDGGHILLNTMREFQKARNLRARPRATLLVVEREGDQRWIEVRGSVLLEEDGALEHLNELTRFYMGAGPYFGRAVPPELALVEHPVRVRLVPSAVATGWQRRSGQHDPRTPTRPPPGGRSPRDALVVDPESSVRWIEIRADVDLIGEGAEEQNDRLTRRYTRHDRYYGPVYPVAQRACETRVIVRLHPRRITCDAIHG